MTPKYVYCETCQQTDYGVNHESVYCVAEEYPVATVDEDTALGDTE